MTVAGDGRLTVIGCPAKSQVVGKGYYLREKRVAFIQKKRTRGG